MVLKTDTQHTKHTAACSPLTNRVSKVVFKGVQLGRKQELMYK